MRVHRGALIQRGSGGQRGIGFGGFLRGIFNAAKPMLRTALRVGKKAMHNPLVRDTVNDLKEGLVEVASASAVDVLKGSSLKDSLIKNANTAKEELQNNLINRVENAALKRKNIDGCNSKKKCKTKRRKRKRKNVSQKDLFDDSESE